MEARFHHDFGRVRVHAHSKASRSADAMNAEAYTVGRDIVFGPGRYAPQTSAGRGLLVHELAHVVQQGRGGPSTAARAERLEGDADAAASRFVSSGGPVRVAEASRPGLARQKKGFDYAKAYVGNRAFATVFRDKVPENWPYTDRLRELWAATTPFWEYDEKTRRVKVIDEAGGVEAAKEFIDEVRALQGDNGLPNHGVLDKRTAGALLGKAKAPATPESELAKPSGEAEEPDPAETGSKDEETDVYAGAFIGLREVAEALGEQIGSTRARGLVWRESRTFGGSHEVDWNPALDSLSSSLEGVGDWITGALSHAALTFGKEKGKAREQAVGLLNRAVSRIGLGLQLIGAYLAAIRAAQYALHDAPSYVTGELGFNEGIVDRANVLYAHLKDLQGGKTDLAELTKKSKATIENTDKYIRRFYAGLKDGAKLLELAEVIGIITAVFGIGSALVGITRLLAQTGGRGLAVAGAYGGSRLVGAEAIVGAAEIQGILQGVKVASAGGVMMMAGGKGPTDVGKAGEAAAGVTGPKTRIPAASGKVQYRVPDKLTHLTLEEVKNVAKLSYRTQLKDFLVYAQRTNREFILWIRKTTTLSEPLKDLVKQGLIKIKYL